MNSASEYLRYVEGMIIDNPYVKSWEVVREEVQGDAGLFRYRLRLVNDEMLEAFELFRVCENTIERAKYSFHLQDTTGELIRRWDNAPHHPDIKSAPHHKHDGEDDCVAPSQEMTLEQLLEEHLQ